MTSQRIVNVVGQEVSDRMLAIALWPYRGYPEVREHRRQLLAASKQFPRIAVPEPPLNSND